MKKKATLIERYSFQPLLLPEFRIYHQKKSSLLEKVREYQKAIDVTAAAAVIGLMSLAAIWLFLVELSVLAGGG